MNINIDVLEIISIILAVVASFWAGYEKGRNKEVESNFDFDSMKKKLDDALK